MLISNLKVTNSLRVDFTEFAWAVFWLPSFYFWLNPFSDVPSFSSLGILLDILEPTRAAVSIPYLTVQMFRDLNLSLFLREYRHSIKSKTSFMISGADFILTLTISISNFCKLQSCNSYDSFMNAIYMVNLGLWNIQTTGAYENWDVMRHKIPPNNY